MFVSQQRRRRQQTPKIQRGTQPTTTPPEHVTYPSGAAPLDMLFILLSVSIVLNRSDSVAGEEDFSSRRKTRTKRMANMTAM